MAPKKSRSRPRNNCKHSRLTYEPSPYASEADFARASSKERAFAARTARKGTRPDLEVALEARPSTFPAPLVLPDDALDIESDYEGQDLQEFLGFKQRNKVVDPSKVLYVVRAPQVSPEVADTVGKWCVPAKIAAARIPRPDEEVIAEYLRAFYHGLEVRLYDGDLTFTDWQDGPPRKRRQQQNIGRKSKHTEMIGLASSKEVVGIRHR